MQTDDRSVNWNYWRYVPNAKLYEAVALSLDIDPNKVQFNRGAWGGGEDLFDEGPEFRSRMKLAKASIGTMKVTGIAIGDESKNEIDLASFAAWAISVLWNIPDELRAVACKGAEDPRKTREKGGIQSELHARERGSLLRIIRALSTMANVDKRGAASAVEKQLQELGFDGPKEATIRSILKEANDLQL